MAEVIYTRKNTDAEANNTQIEDGQLIYTKQGHVFMDFGTDRIPMQNTPDNSMSDSSTNSVSNNVIKEYVDDNIEEINNEIGKEILWRNNNLSSEFAGQTINLSRSLSNFGGYEILFIQRNTNQRIGTTGIIPVGYGCILTIGISNNLRATNTVVSGSGITFEDCYDTGIVDNTRLIPYLVIGHKTTIFNGA